MTEEPVTDINQPENMEVHHHPEVEKKGLKAYLLEGLMIFLAVTLGFLAEGLRERMNNKEKEKEYIHSLLNNLEDDRKHLQYSISENNSKINNLDSLLSFANADFNDVNNRKAVYKYAGKSVGYYSAYGSNDATMQQLLHSGGLQYIRHAHIADSIAHYDQEMRGIEKAETLYSKSIDDAMDMVSTLLVSAAKNDTSTRANTFPFLINDPTRMALFFNKISFERGWTKNYINNLQERVPVNARLIELLRKEYYITDN